MTLLLAVTAAPAAGAEAGGSPATSMPSSSPDRVIVEWASGTDRAERSDAREDAEVLSMRTLGAPDFQLVRIEAGQSLEEALATLRTDPAVRVATRDGYSYPSAAPNDPLFSQLWGLRNLGTGIDGFVGAHAGSDIDALGAWSRTVGSPSTVIADLDSGYRFDSPDLGPVAWSNADEIAGNSVDDDANGFVDDFRGYDFVGPNAESPTTDNDPTDDNLVSGGHGVHTAGTMGAAGNDGVGITGVAQNVRIMALRVCANSPKTKKAACPLSSQIAAINYAGGNGARVANMSLGGTTSSVAVRDALAKNPQTLYVIAAGNEAQDNDPSPRYPCNYNPATSGISGAIDNVVCVAATNQADGLASFSNWGTTSVDLGAPGTETLSTHPSIGVEFDEDFQVDDFASTWSNSGGEGWGRAGVGDGPLTSFGMSDSPAATPQPNSVHNITLTTGIPLPAGTGACTLSAMRYRSGGTGGSFFYSVLSDGSTVFFNDVSTPTGGSAMVPFRTDPITGLGGHSVKLTFGFTAGPSPSADDGIWLDDLNLTCYRPLATSVGYAYLDGTSMSAPHVTGVAGLLFSLKPSATVTEVRNALLSNVDPVPSLTGKTVTGGRLDASAAIDAFDEQAPPAPQLTSTVPASPAEENHPSVVGSAEERSTVRIYAGGSCAGSPVASGTAAELASPGITVAVADGTTAQFSATATDTASNASPCSTPISYTNSSPTDTVAPSAPELTSTLPASPAADTHPKIVGSAEEDSTVKIYAGATCDGVPAATGPAEQLGSPGIAVQVTADSTTAFVATATDESLNTSPCSAPLEYVNVQPVILVTPPVPAAGPLLAPAAPMCTVPSLAGKTLAQAKGALALARCAPGRVRKPRARRGHKPHPLVVKSTSPGAGTRLPAGGTVDLTLGPKAKPKKRRH